MNFKLDHINLTVNNIDESIDWYAKLFGLELLEQGVKPDKTRWAIVGRNDSMICMTEYKDRKISKEYVDSDFHQIYHFGFRVPDRQVWEETVEKYNLKLYYGGINEYPHSDSWYVKDPNGHTIEVSYTDKPTLEFPQR